MAQVTISDVAKAILALDAEEYHLKKHQMALAQSQYNTWLRLEAIKAAREELWRKRNDS